MLLRVIAKVIDVLVIAAAINAVPWVGYLAGLVYLVISDGIFDGRSLGKKIMKLRVITFPGGEPAAFRDSIIRNAPFVLALLLYKVPLLGWIFAAAVVVFEFLLMIGNKEGMRLGDDLASTKVIEG